MIIQIDEKTRIHGTSMCWQLERQKYRKEKGPVWEPYKYFATFGQALGAAGADEIRTHPAHTRLPRQSRPPPRSYRNTVSCSGLQRLNVGRSALTNPPGTMHSARGCLGARHRDPSGPAVRLAIPQPGHTGTLLQARLQNRLVFQPNR